MNEEPQFKNEFFGEFVSKGEPKPNLDYKIYQPMDYYLLRRWNEATHPEFLSSSAYRDWGGCWLVELIDGKFNNSWHFDRHEHARYWRDAKHQSGGKAEIIFPKYEKEKRNDL